MKKNTLYLFILLLITGLNTSCNYLDIVPDETATEKDAFANPRAALRYLYSCYGYLPQSNMVQSCMDFTGDETISPFAESYVKFAEGSYDSSNTIISYWNTLFQGIRQCYLLKENIHSVPKISQEEVDLYTAEADFLIAYFHLLLIKCYGPTILVKELPALDTPAENMLGRRPYDECIDWVADLLDDAATRLPATRNSSDYGRATSVIAKSLKARMLLYAASPLVNGTGNAGELWLGYPENNPERWKYAADICRTIINSGQFMLEKDRTRLSRTAVNGEVLWVRNGQYGNGTYDRSWGYRNSPMGTDDPGSKKYGACQGQTSPTQELVDAFPMKNGKTIEEAKLSGEYDPQNPYVNRDPRLNQTIFYNGARWLKRTLDMSEGGADNNKDNPNNEGIRTKTGYYLKRHLAQDEEETTFHKTNYHATMPGVWMIVRYADVLLMYAEAQTEYLNKAQGQGTISDETVYAAIEQVRERAGLNPYTLKRNMSYEELIKIIRNERRCEFAFEESRFWDIRRWKIAEDVYSKPLHGVKITKNADNTFHYDYNMVVTNPFWDNRMYRLPIDNNEVLYNPNIKQNPGY